MLYDADGNVRTPSQIVKLTHDTVEWKNFLNNLPATFGMAKVEKVLSDLGNGEYKEVENPVEITKEVEAVFKTPEKELTPEQKRIAELEEAVKALSKGNKSTKGIDLLEELKKECGEEDGIFTDINGNVLDESIIGIREIGNIHENKDLLS